MEEKMRREERKIERNKNKKEIRSKKRKKMSELRIE